MPTWPGTQQKSLSLRVRSHLWIFFQHEGDGKKDCQWSAKLFESQSRWQTRFQEAEVSAQPQGVWLEVLLWTQRRQMETCQTQPCEETHLQPSVQTGIADSWAYECFMNLARSVPENKQFIVVEKIALGGGGALLNRDRGKDRFSTSQFSPRARSRARVLKPKGIW